MTWNAIVACETSLCEVLFSSASKKNGLYGNEEVMEGMRGI